MNKFVRGHKRKFIIGNGIVIAAFIISAAISFIEPQVTLFFSSHKGAVLYRNETTELDVNVNASIPVNAFDVMVAYPLDMLEVTGTNKRETFLDLWAHEEEHPQINGVAEVHFTGGTTERGGHMGTGTAITLNIRAKKVGTAEIYFKDPQVIASDGKGTIVPIETQAFIYTIAEEPPKVTANVGQSISIDAPNNLGVETSPYPDPDLDGDGEITVIDLSILLLHMFASYSVRYDLNYDGTLSLSDLSALLSRL